MVKDFVDPYDAPSIHPLRCQNSILQVGCIRLDCSGENFSKKVKLSAVRPLDQESCCEAQSESLLFLVH